MAPNCIRGNNRKFLYARPAAAATSITPRSSSVILYDMRVIVAAINERDQDHDLNVDALRSVQVGLITTWASFTAAMYLLGENGLFRGPDRSPIGSLLPGSQYRR
ncbi:MAG TPA: hypothetical protein VFJ58_02700 [Armatimonadota bacterium]|nr:hypothetical protein [Armatimonadota bacterium]